MESASTAAVAIALSALLGGCADNPPTPDWQLNAKGGIDRAVVAYFTGDARAETQETDAVRSAISRTARPALLARAELVRCAGRAASLVLEPCAAFDAVAADAEPAERAYAAYLGGRAAPADVALLPEQHRAIGASSATPGSDLAAIEHMTDPLSKLVGAAVALQRGRATPEIVAAAVDAASARGWRRPLLAWLTVQLRQAEAAGDSAAAARIRRRIDLAAGTSAAPLAPTGVTAGDRPA